MHPFVRVYSLMSLNECIHPMHRASLEVSHSHHLRDSCEPLQAVLSRRSLNLISRAPVTPQAFFVHLPLLIMLQRLVHAWRPFWLSAAARLHCLASRILLIQSLVDGQTLGLLLGLSTTDKAAVKRS